MSDKKTILETINAESRQEHSLRVPLLKEISEHFQSTVLSFYTTFFSDRGAIIDNDVSIIKDILSSTNGRSTSLLLIINSPGGDPLAAERIVHVCRGFAEHYSVLIPDKAKSAATMISLGAEKILMTPSSELGPIDIQVSWGGGLLPAHVIIKSYEDLLERCQLTPQDQRVEQFLHQLQAYNPAQIEHLRLLRDLSKEIAFKTLSEGMMRGARKVDIEENLRRFLDPEELKSHGRPIFYEDIKKFDSRENIKVELILPDLPIAAKIHEYHQRVLAHIGANQLSKLCETMHSSFSAA